MSDLNCIARVAGVSPGTGAAKTLIQLLTPANQRVKIKELGVGFHGVSNTDVPVTVDLLYQTTAGTASALTVNPEDASAVETPQTTAQQTFTAEPTAGTVIRTFAVHPQTGLVLLFGVGQEIRVGGGKRLALRVNETTTNVAADAYLKFEE